MIKKRLLFAVVFSLFASAVFAQVSIAPYPRWKAFYPGTGTPCSGCELYTCSIGVTCGPGSAYLTATYTDSTAKTPNTNPVILDTNGEADVWLSGYYKFALYDQSGVPIWTRDNISSVANGTAFYAHSYLTGLTLSTAGSTGIFGISAGQATDNTGEISALLPSAWTKTNGSWAAGTGAGALDTGSIAASSWYAVYLIEGSAGVDILCTKESAGFAPSPSLPTGYAFFRYIGSMATDGSKNWLHFLQLGDTFYKIPTMDYSATALMSATLETLQVPLGITVQPVLNFVLNAAVTLGSYAQVNIGPGTDSALSIQAVTIGSGGDLKSVMVAPPTNTSAQIYVAVLGTEPIALQIWSNGWVDRRGRDE